MDCEEVINQNIADIKGEWKREAVSDREEGGREKEREREREREQGRESERGEDKWRARELSR